VKLSRPVAALPALLILASCYPTPVAETVYLPCHVLSSSDWKARVEIFPSAHPKPILRRRLIVTGKVIVAGNGYSVTLERGPVAKLEDPIQQVLVRTEGSLEADPVPVTHNVRAVLPALKRYGGVAIRCGDGLIGEIKDVPAPPRGKG
jgi:hypothetical protein